MVRTVVYDDPEVQERYAALAPQTLGLIAPWQRRALRKEAEAASTHAGATSVFTVIEASLPWPRAQSSAAG